MKILLDRDKNKTLYSFNIFVPINFSISGKKSFLKELESRCDEADTDKTEYTKKFLLRKAGIKSWKELMQKTDNYKMLQRSVKDELKKSLKTFNLSRYINEEMKKEWDEEDNN